MTSSQRYIRVYTDVNAGGEVFRDTGYCLLSIKVLEWEGWKLTIKTNMMPKEGLLPNAD